MKQAQNYKGIRSIAAALTLLLLVFPFLSACGPAADLSADRKPTVICTIFPLYEFAREICGEDANVSQLLPSGSEVHSFEPSPKDIIAIKNCDLFLYIGGESDAYLDSILSTAADKPNFHAIALIGQVSILSEETVEGMEDGGEDSEEEEPDEHIWTSMKNCAEMCGAICDALCEIDPAHADAYRERTNVYQNELSGLDDAFRKLAEDAEHPVLIFGDRFPFRYFADRYGFPYYAAFPGCSSESEPSAATISFLIRKADEAKVPAVFYTESSNRSAANAIAEYTGAKAVLLHSCHNVSSAERKNGVTFLSLMRGNLETLKEVYHLDGNHPMQ